MAVFDPMENLLHPPRTLSALRALSASFFSVETRGPKSQPYHACALVNHHHAAGSEKRTFLSQRLEVHPDVALFGTENGNRRAARYDALQLVAIAHAPALLLDEFH